MIVPVASKYVCVRESGCARAQAGESLRVAAIIGICILSLFNLLLRTLDERWGAGVETQKNVRGEIGGWGRVPFNEPYAPSLSTIYDGA